MCYVFDEDQIEEMDSFSQLNGTILELNYEIEQLERINTSVQLG